jgi:hypothetical protein
VYHVTSPTDQGEIKMTQYLQSSTEFRNTRLPSTPYKLNFSAANEIRRRYFKEGKTQVELGIMFGCTPENINHIVNFRTYKYSV